MNLLLRANLGQTFAYVSQEQSHKNEVCPKDQPKVRPDAVLTCQHLHQDLLENIGLLTSETLTLVETRITGLEVSQSDSEDSSQSVICDDGAPIPFPQEGQQPHTVCAHHTLAWALLSQLATPSLTSPPVLQGVVST